MLDDDYSLLSDKARENYYRPLLQKASSPAHLEQLRKQLERTEVADFSFDAVSHQKEQKALDAAYIAELVQRAKSDETFRKLLEQEQANPQRPSSFDLPTPSC